MKSFVVFSAIIVVAASSSLRAGWDAPTTPGWTTTTPGWTTQPPTTGWPAPTTTQGWSTPGWSTPGWNAPASGWGANVNIALEGDVAAAGQGWAAENHAESVEATGGWGVPAEVNLVSGGDSLLDQVGSLTQVTNIDGNSAGSLNLAAVSQLVDAGEQLAFNAGGLEVISGASGWAGAGGEGSSAADASSHIDANTAGWGQVAP